MPPPTRLHRCAHANCPALATETRTGTSFRTGLPWRLDYCSTHAHDCDVRHEAAHVRRGSRVTARELEER